MVPQQELPYLKEIYEQTDCPKFLEIEGQFMIQYREPGKRWWNDYTHCSSVRMGIEMLRNQGDGFELRLLDLENGSWIEP